MHLTLCGISSRADIGKLILRLSNLHQQFMPRRWCWYWYWYWAPPKTVYCQLAEQHSNVVKDYLVTTQAIEASRLIVCEPAYDENAELPHTAISI